MLGYKKTDHVNSFTYLGGVISEDEECSEIYKNRIATAHRVFQLKEVWKNMEISLQINIRKLKATVMKAVKCASETWTLQIESQLEN